MNSPSPVDPMRSQQLSINVQLLWGLLILFVLAWFYALGMRTLVPTDEGRYAEMAREMLASGDWITPRLNGIKYFEKPPLQAWMNTLTFAIFGLGDWQARLWTGFCGLLGVVITGYTGLRLYGPRTGLYATLILASCLWWFGLGHINTLDMGLSGMMTVALCCLLLAQRDSATSMARRYWMRWCWVGIALAVLSKGLIGLVLPGAVLVLYTLASRDWSIWKRLNLTQGVPLFFLICTPWFVLVSLKNPEFPHFFFIHEHFQRFSSEVHGRQGPWYYFIPLLLIGLLPWLGLLPVSLWRAIKQSRPLFHIEIMLLIWSGFIFVFFSISGSKLPSYILPIFPALALLMGAAMAQEHGEPPKDGFLQSSAQWNFVLLALVAGMGLYWVPEVGRFASHPFEKPYVLAVKPWLYAACGLMLVGTLLGLAFYLKARREMAMLTLAVAGFGFWFLVFAGTNSHGSYRAGMTLIPAIEAELKPETKLYFVGMYDQTLPFYLRRTFTLVEHQDELEFGLKQEPHLWIRHRKDFVKAWLDGPPAIAVMPPHRFVDLHGERLRMRVMTRDSRRVVVTNQMQPAPMPPKQP
jgi:4-amino-4-deoxy-L-arabinose transferase-like glycosyltransferase